MEVTDAKPKDSTGICKRCNRSMGTLNSDERRNRVARSPELKERTARGATRSITGGGCNELRTICDTHKYAETLLDVAESILGVFGFSRAQLGFQRRPENFLEELRGERGKEILPELESLEDPVEPQRLRSR
jgi:hypothetical protein